MPITHRNFFVFANSFFTTLTALAVTIKVMMDILVKYLSIASNSVSAAAILTIIRCVWLPTCIVIMLRKVIENTKLLVELFQLLRRYLWVCYCRDRRVYAQNQPFVLVDVDLHDATISRWRAFDFFFKRIPVFTDRLKTGLDQNILLYYLVNKGFRFKIVMFR